MAREICVACGKRTDGGNYCGHCGESLDDDHQAQISAELNADSERRHLAGEARRLKEFAESDAERETLEGLAARIEEMPLSAFME